MCPNIRLRPLYQHQQPTNNNNNTNHAAQYPPVTMPNFRRRPGAGCPSTIAQKPLAHSRLARHPPSSRPCFIIRQPRQCCHRTTTETMPHSTAIETGMPHRTAAETVPWTRDGIPATPTRLPPPHLRTPSLENRMLPNRTSAEPTTHEKMMMSFVCSCRNKIGPELHIYLEEGTYHKRLFRGPSTNDMKK